jgi:peptidase E
MTKGKSNSVNILCIYFAREKDAWDRLFEQDKKAFLEASPTKVLKLTRAEDNIKIFKEQIYKNDVIYIRG